MIWTEELPASLDQSAGVIIFHRVELTRPQQLAQILAEKVGAMVEQNEKALDIRLGGATTWGDRVDGLKGDKRGEQAQERRGRGERRGGVSARGTLRVHSLVAFITHRFICTIQAQGLDEEHALHRGLGVRCSKCDSRVCGLLMAVLYVHYSHFQLAHACFDSLSWGAPQPHYTFSTGSGGSSATRPFGGVVENCHPHNVDL